MNIPKTWITRLETERDKVGKVRDSLESTLEEMEEMKRNADDAYEAIEEAIECLSRLA